MKKGIIGFGGFGREVYYSMTDEEKQDITFFVDDAFFNNEKNVLPLSKFNPKTHEVIVAIGDPHKRKNVIDSLPKNTKFFTFIHKSVLILDERVEIGEGSIICPNVILTTNIKLGKHTHLNLSTTIGHDCNIGEYFTTAPGAKISGNCTIGNLVYIGTNSSIREKLTITDNVTIGLNSGVVKNINESGVYGGTPIKKLK